MRSTLLRVIVAATTAIALSIALVNFFEAAFLVKINGPKSAFHVPTWLEPFSYTAELLCDLAPGVVLGAIARWRPAILGLAVGFLSFYLAAILPDSRDAVLSTWGLDVAFRRAIFWSAGAVVGFYAWQLWMPNTSFERTRDR